MIKIFKKILKILKFLKVRMNNTNNKMIIINNNIKHFSNNKNKLNKQ